MEVLLVELFHWAELLPYEIEGCLIYFILIYSLVTVIRIDGCSFMNLMRNNNLST